MDKTNFNSNLELFKEIFKKDLLEYDVSHFYQHEEVDVTWSDEQIQKLVESNQELKDFIFNLIEWVIEREVDTFGGSYSVKTSTNNNQLGFIINSGYSHSMLSDIADPEGEADSAAYYSDDFIKKLNSFDELKGINKQNLSDYLEFKISEGSVWYFNIFSSEENKFIDSDDFDNGDEIVDLFNDLFGEFIYEKFNFVNDQTEFTQNYIYYYSEKQTVLQEDVFIPLTDFYDLDDLVEELNELMGN